MSFMARGATSGKRSHVWTPVNNNFALIFDEEFNGSSLAGSRWNSLEGNVLQNVVVHRSNIAVSNSCARVTLAGPYTGMSGAFFTTYSSTDNFSFNASSGAVYMEGRCKQPTTPAQGAWPAFWTNFGGNFPEIDLFEWAGSRPTLAYQTFHKVNDGASPPTGTNGWGMGAVPDLGVDLSAAFHIYGVLWTSTDMTFYIDGVQRFTIHNGDTVTGDSEGGRWGATPVQIVFPTGAESQFINVQTGANGLGNNTANAGTVFPSTLLVDYIHVYQVGGTPVTPQAGYNGPGSLQGPTS